MSTSPSTTDWQYREDLGMRYEEFDLAMNQMKFIAHRVLPIIGRTEQAGKFPRVPVEQLMQMLETSRASGGTYRRSNRTFTKDDYETVEHGLEAVIDARVKSRYDDLVDAEVFEGQVLENAILSAYEKEVADLMFNTATFSGRTGDVSTEWSDLSSSTPVADVDAEVTTIRTACGVKPNALIINDIVFRNLINNASIIDRLKYQGFADARPGEISQQALAISLNLDEVIVADGLYNPVAPEGEASLTDFWSSEYALLARVAKTPNPAERCIGRTIMCTEEGQADGERMGMIAESYYEDQSRSTIIRRRTDWGLKTLQLECGYLFSNITA